MAKKQSIPLLSRFLFIVLALLAVFFLGKRLQLGIERGFNLDEFAYLNWAAHVARGDRPYVDFFMFVTPGFVVTLAPLFWFFHGVSSAVAARVVAWVIYAGMAGTMGLIFWQLKRSWIAIVAVVVLSMLPLPSDNLLEVRPDNLSLLLFLIGLFVQLRFMKNPGVHSAFWVGTLYALSLLTLQKSLPMVTVALVFLMIYFLASKGSAFRGWKGLASGFVWPWALFGFFMLATGDPGQVIYSTTTMLFEASNISLNYFFSYNQFFQPNSFYYGEGGRSIGLVVNNALWVGALGVAMVRLVLTVTAGFRALKKRILTIRTDNLLEEFLLVVLFLMSAGLFAYVMPLKHTQYLIPISVFVGYYIADGLFMVWNHARKYRWSQIIYGVFLVLSSWFLVLAFVSVDTPKFRRDNARQLAQMQTFFDTVPHDTYVLDLEGRMFMYPYPYYVCCLSFMQFESFLSRPLPSLKDALEETQTQFIYQEKFDKIGALKPKDREYIYENYVPEWQGELWVRKN